MEGLENPSALTVQQFSELKPERTINIVLNPIRFLPKNPTVLTHKADYENTMSLRLGAGYVLA